MTSVRDERESEAGKTANGWRLVLSVVFNLRAEAPGTAAAGSASSEARARFRWGARFPDALPPRSLKRHGINTA